MNTVQDVVGWLNDHCDWADKSAIEGEPHDLVLRMEEILSAHFKIEIKICVKETHLILKSISKQGGRKRKGGTTLQEFTSDYIFTLCVGHLRDGDWRLYSGTHEGFTEAGLANWVERAVLPVRVHARNTEEWAEIGTTLPGIKEL